MTCATLPIAVQAAEPRWFCLARWDAPAEEPMLTVEARDAREAAVLALGAGARTLALPALDAALCVTDDAEWLVLEADGMAATQGALWASFHQRERALFVSGWFRLRSLA